MVKKDVKVRVNSNEFTWDQEEGLFLFDGAPALLFWDSAIKLFLDTIEEVSGKEASTTVFESTGYRMGHLVTAYYDKKSDHEKLLTQYSDIYKNAGWGNYEIVDYSFEKKKATIRLTNSWEHRIFKNAEKDAASVILPSHWAGVFAGLFKENMWYSITKKQADGFDYDEVEIFPSNFTPSQNIHDLARKKEQQSILELEEKVNERTKELTGLVNELSSPVIPVLGGILVIPLIGKYNEERLKDLQEHALFEVSKQRANFLLIDVTGLSNADDITILHIHKLISAIRLLGSECYIVGISAELSIEMITSQMTLNDVKSFSNLQQGVEYAIKQNGYQLVKLNG